MRRLGSPRELWSRLRAFTRPGPPPALRVEQALYGFAQPLAGARILLSEKGLLAEALMPAAVLGAFCGLFATVSNDAPGWLGWLGAFYKIFALFAPLPSLVFANHYARLGAMVRWRLGFGVCAPREMPMGMLIGRLIRQTLIVAIGVIPFAVVPRILPGIGPLLSNLVVAAWGVHWVVADAFDDAQVLRPGETLRASVARDHAAPSPWFVRLLDLAAGKLPIIGRLLHKFARLCDRLAMDSRGEIHLMEQNKFIALGFALSTAALMATPVLNLFFRPVILAASSHLLGYLEVSEAETPTSALAK